MAKKGSFFAALEASKTVGSSVGTASTLSLCARDRLEKVAAVMASDDESEYVGDYKMIEMSGNDSRDPLTRKQQREILENHNMAKELHKELFRLIMVEADEQERLDALGEKTQALAAEHENTQAKIGEAQATLEEIAKNQLMSVRVKKRQIVELEAAIKSAEIEKEDIETNMRNKIRSLEDNIMEYSNELIGIRRSVHYLEQGEHMQPGPYQLRFLDGENFQIVMAGVILSNLLLMFLQFTHPDIDMSNLSWCFLAFYVVELVLNISYKQRNFFYGNPYTVCWNWMDAIIVVCGVIEFTISTMCLMDASVLSFLRIFRLLRLVRVMKIVKIFLTSDLSWADGQAFQTFMMAVIIVNTLIMGLESENRDNPLWPYLDNILLVIYTFEILVRMKFQGCAFCLGGRRVPLSELIWNWLDSVIVCGGIVDMWILPIIASAKRLMGYPHSSNETFGDMMSMIRMARLARILRLIKIVKSVPPLYTLVVGIVRAMQGMGWVMLLTVGVLYICALLGVKLVGEGMLVPADLSAEDQTAVMGTFDNIPNSVFRLFKAMNADLGGFEPLLKHVETSKYVLMFYMVVTNWALFSILTAVVSDNMAKVTGEHDGELEKAALEQARQMRETKLDLMFKRLDMNGNDEISKDEFQHVLSDEAACTEMCSITGLRPADLQDVFELIATCKEDTEDEYIKKTDFVRLLDKECGGVSARSILKLEQRLMKMEAVIHEVRAG